MKILLGMIIGSIVNELIGEINYRIQTAIEKRRPTPTLEELNNINRELYAECRKRLSENLRQTGSR